MNTKIVFALVAILILSAATTPFVHAAPFADGPVIVWNECDEETGEECDDDEAYIWGD
ncbi:hypothetical protein KFU94_50885 [Chloroflexi bacterium TSY]|nr:hypothetical protein [Chloroflexi bacterium TSY]